MEKMKKDKIKYEGMSELIDDIESTVYSILELQHEIDTYKDNITRSLDKLISSMHNIRYKTNFDNDDESQLISCKWHCSMELYDGDCTSHGDIYLLDNGIFLVHTLSAYPELRKWELQTPAEIIDNYRGVLSEEDKNYIMNVGGI